MSTYINVGNIPFRSSRMGEYVDKSGLIGVINSTLNSDRRFVCVTRSRRFGKSMAAKMLCAYYDKSCDSRSLFEDLEIVNHSSFEEHLNKYRVLYIDLSKLVTLFKDDEAIVKKMQQVVIDDVCQFYPDIEVREYYGLSDVLLRIVEKYGDTFFLIIDEWDAICREFTLGTKAMDDYVNWLRSMFKDVNALRIFAGVYMTGILPIKKYRTESALNNFWEYSVVLPRNAAKYYGFTKSEVQQLCEKYGMDFEEMAKWYDGYQIGTESSMFNPNSVVQAVYARECDSYWASTGAYDNVSRYIQMNYEGLKDDVINMLGGGRCKVDTTSFVNDMSIIRCKDDVFTVLIHLGYLGYDKQRKECYIPNKEVAGEMVNAIKANDWTIVIKALQASECLLELTLEGDEEAVAQAVERVHDDNISILSYNDENSLSCVLNLAYYYAKNDYIFYRELASGKGFADIVLIPRRNVEKPAIILELKYKKDADTAIEQIKRKQYTEKVSEYTGEMLLVGINYDKKEKRHTCRIERVVKGSGRG